MISLCKHAPPGAVTQLTCALSEDNLDSLQVGFALLLHGKRLNLPGCDLAFLFGKDQEAAGLRLKVLAHHLDFPEDGVLQTASFPEGHHVCPMEFPDRVVYAVVLTPPTLTRMRQRKRIQFRARWTAAENIPGGSRVIPAAEVAPDLPLITEIASLQVLVFWGLTDESLEAELRPLIGPETRICRHDKETP